MSTLTSRQRLMLALTVGAFAAAGILHYATPGVAAFIAATVALGGVAWTVGLGTEELGAKLKPGATGVLQSTLGNLPEFFIVVFALAAGEVVARTSIIGSIFANALLMLGIGDRRRRAESNDGTMRFHARPAEGHATLMMLASFLIVMDLGISIATAKAAAPRQGDLDRRGGRAARRLRRVAVRLPRRTDEAAREVRPRAARLDERARGSFCWRRRRRRAFVSDWFIEALTRRSTRSASPRRSPAS
jgi:hypothetical protein